MSQTLETPPPVEGPPDIEPERLDADAVRVVLRLRQAGHEAYLVGGCVRDLLLGREPKDFDIATSATPDQVRGLFRNCRLIGRRFRLAHVYFRGGKILEVSTFRANPLVVEEPQPSEAQEGEMHAEGTENIAFADVEALDAVELDAPVPTDPVPDLQDTEAARPAERDLLIVEDNTFGTALEDARRRDFTVNALFYDPLPGRVLDYVGGLKDLAAGEICTIGDPEKRLREDPVRILRGVRFAAKLGLDIEARTYAAMEGVVEDLPRCAPPRLLEETFRLLRGGTAAPALRLLLALDALKSLLPPLDEWLRAQSAEDVQSYLDVVAEMDALVNAGATFDDSMLLASALLPLAWEEQPAPDPSNGATGHQAAAADAVAPGEPPSSEAPPVEPTLEEPAVAAAPVEAGPPPEAPQQPNRAIEQLLVRLVQTARLPRRIAERCRVILVAQRTLAGLRRRRGGLGGFRGHPLFRESLAVFEVWVNATGEYEEALATWKAGGSPSVSPGAVGPRRRKRRRR